MKKILALALAMVMCVTSVVTVFADTASVDETANVQTEAFIADLIGMAEGGKDDAALLLEYSDVLKTVYPEYKAYSSMEDKVTRADFLTSLVSLVYGTNYPAYTLFGDVAADKTSLSGSLSCAIKVGMISEGPLFRPDDALTYSEMYKMATVALGYDMLALQYGGYPAGYTYVALKTGINNNVEGTDGEVSAKDALTVLYNVLTLEFMEQTSFGETFKYTVAEGKSILSERFNINLIAGIVNADEVSSLTNEAASIADDEIQIGTKTYKNLSGKSLLGYNVKAYIRTSGSREEVISIHKYENNEIFTNDFDFLSQTKIRVFEPDGKSKDYSIYRGYSAILNNAAAPYVNLSDYEGRDDVTIYLVDNNNDRTFDIIKIYDWDYMQIGNIDSVNMILFDEYAPVAYSDGRVTKEAALNLNPEDVYFKVYDFTGTALREISFDELSVGDVISYCLSSGGKSAYVFKSSYKVTGVLDEYSQVDKKMWVNSTPYELSGYAYDKFSNFIIGENITLYLDATGKITAFTQGDDGFFYGYIIAMAKNSGLDADYKIKMLTQNGDIEIFDVADEPYFDGLKKPASDVKAYVDSLERDDRLVKYSAGSKGEITSVDFEEDANPVLPFTEEKPMRNSLTLYYDLSSHEVSMQGVVDGKFVAESSTIVFQIPTDAKKDDESYYLIKSFSSYYNGQKDIKAYDMSAGRGPKVVLIVKNELTPNVGEYNPSMVFLGLTDGLNADGEVCKLMTTYTGSAYNKYYVNPSEVDLSGLVPGDIIAVSVYKNEVKSMMIQYSRRPGDAEYINVPNGAEWSIGSGYVYSYGPSMIQLWTTLNVNSQVNISNIKGVDFKKQNVTFVDLYKNSEGTIYKAMARYKPVSEIKTYLTSGTDMDYYVARTDGAKWIFRIIEK